MKLRHLFALAAGLALGTTAHAQLTVTQNTNIAAARSAFGGTIVLDWNNAGAPGSASATAPSGINIDEWISGDGFEGDDLAVNSFETFTLNFAAPVSRIGLAISTGLGSYNPPQYDNTGAIFDLLASNGLTGVATLVDPGNGYAAWFEISSATPFTSLSFTERTPPGTIFDQYFGDVSAAAVPEPATWALMIMGFGAIGGALRRRATRAALA